MKFGFGKGKARDERRDGYSRIPDPDESGSFPHESHELITEDATTSGAQPGPSGQPRSKRLEEAEMLRARARKKGEERDELREQAQKARELGEFSLAETLMKLAKKCWNAMKWLNREAANIFYKVLNWNARPGEVNLHRLHRHEAIERAKKVIQDATSKGQQTIRFITGKGKHSEDGPKILPALQKYITERGLESELDADNAGVLIVHLPRQGS